MSASNWPTESAEALQSFVEGRDRLRRYLGSQRGDDLELAKSSFADAERNDPAFALATFYLAVVESELRDSDSAIERLENLAKREVDFLPETYLHLAYAHTKKYQDTHYAAAEGALDQAQKQAIVLRRRGMVPIIEAYRTFLFSVMGGRLEQRDRRPYYVDKAIELGSRLLGEQAVARLPERDREQVLFEVHNALGISYMRKGQQEAEFSHQQRHAWELAHRHYAEALKLRPNATRVFQNMGTLQGLEGDQLCRKGKVDEARKRYQRALDLYRYSLDLNSHDQFPHYGVAKMAAKLEDWNTAHQFYNSGRQEKGAVKEKDWERLRQAIDREDASGLLTND
jgi:tetratricopeptide (TPR) repeat protein